MLAVLAGMVAVPAATLAQESNTAVDPAAFFSGTVTEMSPESVTVSRTVLGKPPLARTFAITKDTKIEGGKLHNGARVTVRSAQGEGGEVAVSIVVRAKDGTTKKK